MDFKHKYTGSSPIAVSPKTEFAPKNGITISPRIVQKTNSAIRQFGSFIVGPKLFNRIVWLVQFLLK